MINVVKQPVTRKPEDGIKQPIATSLKLKDRRVELDCKRGTPRLLSRLRVFSRHDYYHPPQAAINDGLDAWAHHAAASNGFGDLI